MKNKQHNKVNRREFLQGAAAAGVGAAVAAALPGAVIASPDTTQTKQEALHNNKGYQETGHVRKFYETLSS